MSATSPLPDPCDCTKPVECVDRHPGRYLAAIYWLVTDRQTRLPTGELGARLGVSSASATEMVTKLDAAGLVDYEKYRGVELTADGRTVAEELARRQCVVRTFFASELQTELDAETSYRIGYSLPETGIRRLHGLVDRPSDGCCQRHRAATRDVSARGLTGSERAPLAVGHSPSAHGYCRRHEP